jgi:hypothetical protein
VVLAVTVAAGGDAVMDDDARERLRAIGRHAVIRRSRELSSSPAIMRGGTMPDPPCHHRL